jgi:preprotein translocase subunit YajC
MNTIFSFIFLMPQSPNQSPIPSFVFLLLIIVVFYFFMIRPQMKRQKDLKTYRDSLQKGDKIITTGGIYGKVTDVKENTVTVEISDKVLVKIDKSAVLKDTSDLAAQK